MGKSRRLSFYKRADFWLMLFAIILLLTVILENGLSIDVQIYTTYYVVTYSSMVCLLVSYLAIISTVYFIQYKRTILYQWLTLAHLPLTIMPTTYIFHIIFGYRPGIKGLTNWYYSYINTKGLNEAGQILLIALTCFTFGQIIFVINTFKKRKTTLGNIN